MIIRWILVPYFSDKTLLYFTHCVLDLTVYTLHYSNVAMKNPPFIDDFPNPIGS